MFDVKYEVSVIIPVKNQERLIAQCLDAIVDGDFPRSDFEILVIDNGSVDRTVEVAKKWADKVIEQPEGNVSTLRNEISRLAGGRYLMFIDSDCIAAPDWIRSALRSMGEGIAVTGAHYALPDTPTQLERDWYGQFQNGREVTRFVPAGNLIIRRHLFKALGGFDPVLRANEDKDLCQRAAKYGLVVADSGIVVKHEGNPKTALQFFKTEVWHGAGTLEALKNHWQDRILAMTLVFALGVLLIVSSCCLVMPLLWLLGFSLVAAVLGGSLIHRRKQIRGVGHLLRLGGLYAVYYSARFVSLILSLFKISYYHNTVATR